MADGDDIETPDQVDSMIDELLEAGFSYTSNGRIDGFAGIPEDEDGEDEQGSVDPALDDSGEDGDPGPEGVGEEGDREGDEVPRGAHSGRLELRGTPLTELEADSLLHLRRMLIEHPEFAARVNELAEAQMSGRPAADSIPAPAAEATTDTPDTLPDFIDPDDEATVAMWREVQDLRKQQTETGQTIRETIDNVETEARQARVTSDINAAIDRFRAAHPDLDEAEIQSVRNHTGATVNIPGVMANFPGDPVEGLVRALEIGSLTDPGVRDKVLGRPVEDASTGDEKRKRSLSALSGTSGSGARRPAAVAKPKTYQDVAKRLAEEITALGGAS